MPDRKIDLLGVDRGTVTAPAGCGKTHLIAQTLRRHNGPKPILVLTHTNAGVAALRSRLDKADVPARSYRLSTIDGWAMRLIGMFPRRSDAHPDLLRLTNPKTDYPAIRLAAWKLLKAGHIQELLKATYARQIVDEYQDCSVPQHAIVHYAAQALPTCVLGDPMQAIFGWQGNALADWNEHVCRHFPIVGELDIPWRWRNAGTEELGRWLLDVRRRLSLNQPVDLLLGPSEVTWVNLDGTEDRVRQLRAAQTRALTENGTVLIIGDSRSPQSQRLFASQIPGAVTVEAVDLGDLVLFARTLDFRAENALQKVVEFAASVMTGIGAADLLRRVGVLERGTGRREASDTERAAMIFNTERTPKAAVDLLVEMGREGGVRTHRPAVLRACIKALQGCESADNNSFHEAAIRAREQNRVLGRPLPRRAVGSTLLLKGLEADVSVILDAGDLDARNLYVAMTRGSRRLVVCSTSSKLLR
ncbi:MAG: UvrD-helicase domain-containing protein [Bradyrhizobium sp.]|uniref:UvrD-helicase domain-containing protein n=1 Tax=Bradyrhizobium sp. TaxID=376 RepID=UPI0029B57A00|nr:UvrD-helicase domain-containing protein [Bradyrhizobium sp.]MDX3970784.1 UvrD-helicase domain-containing protein [Bradyrhizobium sp.]